MNIALIGMPGSGKSAVGKALARKLDFAFVDIDTVIEQEVGQPLTTLLPQIGREAFIDLENKALITSVAGKDNLVISPGGSIVFAEEAMRHLQETAKVIFLDIPLTIIRTRIQNTPRAIVGGPTKTLEEIYAERLPLYKKWSLFSVGPHTKVGDVVNEILGKINEGGALHY